MSVVYSVGGRLLEYDVHWLGEWEVMGWVDVVLCGWDVYVGLCSHVPGEGLFVSCGVVLVVCVWGLGWAFEGNEALGAGFECVGVGVWVPTWLYWVVVKGLA